MKDCVKLRKHGTFYSAYEDDAYVVHAALGYKVSNGRLGFPLSALEKVLNELDSSQIDYAIYENDKIVQTENFKKKNHYQKFLEQGRKLAEAKLKEEALIQMIQELTGDQLEKVRSYIEKIRQ